MSKENWTLERVNDELGGPAPLRGVLSGKDMDGKPTFHKACEEYPWPTLGKIILPFTKDQNEEMAARAWPHVAEAIQIYKIDYGRTSRRDIDDSPKGIIEILDQIVEHSGKLFKAFDMFAELAESQSDFRSMKRVDTLKGLHTQMWGIAAYSSEGQKNSIAMSDMQRFDFNKYRDAGQDFEFDLTTKILNLNNAAMLIADQAKNLRAELKRKAGAFNHRAFCLIETLCRVWLHITDGRNPTFKEGMPDALLFTNFVFELLQISHAEELTARKIEMVLETALSKAKHRLSQALLSHRLPVNFTP